MTKARKAATWRTLAEYFDARVLGEREKRADATVWFGLCSTIEDADDIGLLSSLQVDYLYREVERTLEGHTFLHYVRANALFDDGCSPDELVNMRVMWCELMALLVEEVAE